MNTEMLLDELAGLGIHLVRDGEAILADVEDGADVTPHVDRITNHKPALLRELLQREIVAIVTVDPSQFDREHYDDLWQQWRALPDPEAEAAALVPQLEAGWTGSLLTRTTLTTSRSSSAGSRGCVSTNRPLGKEMKDDDRSGDERPRVRQGA